MACTSDSSIMHLLLGSDAFFFSVGGGLWGQGLGRDGMGWDGC